MAKPGYPALRLCVQTSTLRDGLSWRLCNRGGGLPLTLKAHQPGHKLPRNPASFRHFLIEFEIAHGADQIFAQVAIDFAGRIAKAAQVLFDRAHNALGFAGFDLRLALEMCGGPRCAQDDAAQQVLRRLGCQRQAVVVFVGHDGRARYEANDPIGLAGAVAARV